MGSRSTGAYAARSAAVTMPPASWISFASLSASGPLYSHMGPSFAIRRKVWARTGCWTQSPSFTGTPLGRMMAAKGAKRGSSRNLVLLASTAVCSVTCQFSASSATGMTREDHASLPPRRWAMCSPCSSPGTAMARPPSVELPGLLTNMSGVAAAGATSRASMNSARSFLLSQVRMKAPPIGPELEGCTTPMHNAATMAASMAFPPRTSTSAPISEHFFAGVATASLVYVPANRFQASLLSFRA
mmetsp:Transcript_137651/g.239322  ORF Transcript_137651/g.239322 Transcript_137651/m.239322 type:complete len:244 (+) Transcript_137651:2377-3108(+)